jgi:ribosomal protein L29
MLEAALKDKERINKQIRAAKRELAALEAKRTTGFSPKKWTLLKANC